MIDVTCQCGVVYHSDEAHIGRRLRCNRCGRLVAIERPSDDGVVERPPSFSSDKRRSSSPETSKRRTYRYAIAASAIGVAIISLVLLQHPNGPLSESSRNAENSSKVQVVEEVPVPPAAQRHQENELTHIVGPRPTEYNSLPTGTPIEKDIGTYGHGKLTVENGTDEDAAVELSDVATDQTVRYFFMKAHSSAHKTRIPKGTYRLKFATGLNWVELEDTFSWNPSYREFEWTLEYDERRDLEGVHFTTISVTLNPVSFGNVRTKEITREEFLRGHRHVGLEQ